MSRAFLCVMVSILGGAACGAPQQAVHVCASDRQCPSGTRCAEARCTEHAAATPVPAEPAAATCERLEAPRSESRANAFQDMTSRMLGNGRADATGPRTTPRQRWHYDAGAPLHAAPRLDAEGHVYVGSSDGVLHAVGNDGTPRWRKALAGPVRAAAWVEASGRAYVGAGSTLAELAADGHVRWTTQLGHHIVAPPLRGPTGILYVAADGLYALDDAGNVLWHLVTAAPVHSTLALHPEGLVLFGTATGRLVAAHEGRILWQTHVEASVSGGASVDADGRIYVGTDLGELFSIEADGAIRWRVDTGGAIRAVPAVHPDGFVVIGNRAGHIQGHDLETGSLRFQHATSGPVQASARIDRQGRIYVGSHDGFMYALDRDGTRLWHFDVAHAVGASVAIDSDGTLIFTAADGHVHALR